MVLVQITKNFRDIDASVHKLEGLIKSICTRFGVSSATVEVAIVDDAQLRKLNSQFRKCKRSTDCLSFDLSEGRKSQSAKSFELIVNGELAVQEARLRGHSSEAELALYVTHSMLHHLGFDDSTPKQADEMHRTEDEILREFGYGAVYNNQIRRPDSRKTKA